MTRIRSAHSVAALVVAALAARPGFAQNQLWLQQLGSAAVDWARSCAPDGAGGVYIGGDTVGALNGASAGGSDAWIARYDGATGNQLWIRQLGTSGDDLANAVAPDGSGGAYISGSTRGSLGGPFSGGTDIWLAHYDSAGNQLWIRQLSSNGASGFEYATAAASDGAGGVYLTGYTFGSLGGPNAGANDAWLARYDAAGSQLWIRQLGADSDDQAKAAAPDGSGGVYIGGETSGSLGSANAGADDAWLARYDASGNQLWIRQLGGGAPDVIDTVATNASVGVFVGGNTGSSLAGANAGSSDAWLAHYDAAGNQTWLRQLGTSATDGANAASTDDAGGVFFGGFTWGSLAAPNAGDSDAWLAQYDSDGDLIWIRQFGASSWDVAACAAPDGSGGVHVGGSTFAGFGAPGASLLDAWVARFEGAGPQSYCTASTTASGCSASISANASPSATFATPCVLNVANVDGQRQGLIFYGVDNTGFSPLPWSTGSSSFLCVKPPTQRASIQNSGGAVASCDGTLSLDWNAFHAANPGALGAPFTTGSKVYAQGWFRDPPAPKSTNLSNALELTVFP